jgi:hypothetical protein
VELHRKRDPLFAQSTGQINAYVHLQLAFDDPARRFPNKPVASGTMVVYEITLVKLMKEGQVDILELIGKWYQVVIFFAIIGGLVYLNMRKTARKSKGKGKKVR